MEVVSIKAESRSEFGKKANKQLRKEGSIPAVLYGKDGNVAFKTKHNDVKHLIYTPDFKLASIEIDGSTHKAFIKEIQFHPVTDAIQHIDFLKLIDGVKVNVEVPVRFKGVSPGIKAGGKLIQSMRKVKIKAMPDQLVDELIADISEVELGDAIRVRDLVLADGLEVMTEPSIPVASVEVPRVLKTADEDAEAAETAEGAEGAETTEGAEGAETTDA